uniref:Uncharacterized protein n=1 Tax=Tetradesmus obliquus TaxID=3088 RepID=A0A383W4B0_TETOB|eukprot:jgi/Sobl393_1/11194/SZX71962.1
MTNFASSVKAGSATKGVFELDVRFKPLAGVTSNMMVWLLNNDHKNVNFTDSTGKTRVMPMHLLFHPVDHMFHTSSSTPMTVGSKLVWCEIPLTGCRYDLKSHTEPWVCPTNRTGFLQSTPKSTWGKFMQTKMLMTVTVFNSSMLEFVAQKSNPFFGDGPRVVGNTRHTWSDSPAGLQLRTQMFLGLMAPGSNSVFDTSWIAALANPIIAKSYIGSATNVPANNMTSIGHMAALHFLQEYGTLPRWLPKVYNNRQK